MDKRVNPTLVEKKNVETNMRGDREKGTARVRKIHTS
jgi:hypothetical protein